VLKAELENNLGELEKNFYKNEAIMFSRVMSIDDMELAGNLVSLRASRTAFYESLLIDNNEDKISVALFALQAAAAQIGRRIEYLVEKADPIGQKENSISMNLKSFLQRFKPKDGKSSKSSA
jgi:hypothetical protein